MKRWPILIAALLAASPVFATPAITTIVGSAVESSTLTITLTNGGTVGPNVKVHATFEGGTAGAHIPTGAGSATYGQFSGTGSDGYCYYSSSVTLSGTRAMQSDFTLGTNYAPYMNVSLTPGATHFLVDWSWYVPASENFPGENGSGLNFKMIWANQTGTTDGDITLPAQLTTQWLIFSNDGPFNTEKNLTTPSTPLKGAWHHFIAYVKWGDANNQVGQVKIWEVDRTSGLTVLVSSTSAQTQTVGDTGYNNVQIMAFGNNGSTSHVSMDDVYVVDGAASLARVYIGNNATFSSCTKLALLTPTSWSDTSITAIVRKGEFGATDSVYLFVLDAAGTASPGYAVTLGNTYTAPLSGASGFIRGSGQTRGAGFVGYR